MIEDKVYAIEVNGQTFHLHISRPKTNRKFRGSVVNQHRMELGSGRWDTAAQADAALREIAARAAFSRIDGKPKSDGKFKSYGKADGDGKSKLDGKTDGDGKFKLDGKFDGDGKAKLDGNSPLSPKP